MAEYYVVRDKNTGLYFRGKGVNRWGKHYNQASIYRIKANAENTIKEVSWRGEQAEIVPIQIIETTTDAVEVVRCKDCEYGCEEGKNTYTCGNFPYGGIGGYNLGDTFCSFGKRKLQKEKGE